jgi:hypothetical protein
MAREIVALPGWRTPLAWAYVQAGRLDSARAELEELSRDGFAVFPRDANFLARWRSSRMPSASSRTRTSPRASSRCWRRTPTPGSCWVPAPARSAPVAYSLGCCSSCRSARTKP